MSASPYIDNPFHTALLTENAAHAILNGPAARYAPDIIPMGGVAEKTPEAMRAFRDLLAPGEELWTTGDNFPSVEGLAHIRTLPCLQMHYAGPTPVADSDPTLVILTPSDAPDMVALKALAFPGYFYRRAYILGDFFGVRHPKTGELIAMGGERLAVPGFREISSLCTHPAHTGQGHAAKLMRRIMRAQFERGARSFLHVIAANERPIRLYEHLGFETTGVTNFQLFQRTA